jgi:hypothetical protein
VPLGFLLHGDVDGGHREECGQGGGGKSASSTRLRCGRSIRGLSEKV